MSKFCETLPVIRQYEVIKKGHAAMISRNIYIESF